MNLSVEQIFVGGVALIVFLVVAVLVYRRLPKKLKVPKYQESWKELQAYCKDKATWPEAITAADKLLDSALKKRKFKGTSMGERLVSAKDKFTNNDAVWFAHNLYKKVIADPNFKLKEDDVKRALVSFRQALRDIGALDSGESRDTK